MSKKSFYNVIIVGAGIAGLSAAKHLMDLNPHAKILILEANNRVGGRIHSLNTSTGVPIEMGANFLENPGQPDYQNPLIPLLKPLDVYLKATQTIHASEWLSQDALQKIMALIEQSKQKKWHTWPSLATVLKLKKVAKGSELNTLNAIIHMIQQHTGNTAENVSLLELIHPLIPQRLNKRMENPGTLFIGNGYQKLPNSMLDSLTQEPSINILFNTPVNEIHYDLSKKRVRILTDNEKQFEAQTVLCTVPLGVLQKNKITFSPALSLEKKQLIEHLRVGLHNKVILEFDQLFWEKEKPFILKNNDNKNGLAEYINLYYFSAQKTPTLVANFYANEAAFKTQSDNDIIEKALLPLKDLGVKKSFLKKALITRWDTDPHSLGSTSCQGTHAKPNELSYFQKPEPGGLFLAGAHTERISQRETVEGAYFSGIRAALQINRYLQNPSNLKRTDVA